MRAQSASRTEGAENGRVSQAEVMCRQDQLTRSDNLSPRNDYTTRLVLMSIGKTGLGVSAIASFAQVSNVAFSISTVSSAWMHRVGSQRSLALAPALLPPIHYEKTHDPSLCLSRA